MVLSTIYNKSVNRFSYTWSTTLGLPCGHEVMMETETQSYLDFHYSERQVGKQSMIKQRGSIRPLFVCEHVSRNSFEETIHNAFGPQAAWISRSRRSSL